MGKFLHEIDEMPASELTEWQIYESIEPFGDRRGDIQAALITSMIANVNRTRQEPFGLEDFLLNWENVTHGRQTPEQQLELMLIIQKMQNDRLGHA